RSSKMDRSFLQESSDIIMLGTQVVLSAARTSPYVRTRGANIIEMCAVMSAGGGNTVAEQITVDILQADTAAGANAVVCQFEYVYQTLGAPLIGDGLGRATRIQQTLASG